MSSESRSTPSRDVDAVVFDVDGVLTDGCLYYGPTGEELKVFHARDGLGMAMLRDSGVRMGVVSGRNSPLVESRLRELGVSLFEMGRMDKAIALDQLLEQWELPASRVAVIGDDLVDIPMLRRAGFGAAPADADPRVRAVANRVLDANGGHGAVRELAELVLRARGDWEAQCARFEVSS